ncbi:winged helix-turn-helix domain-containing protein [Sanguibacter sp. A247]|uniref:winged helix-turn-helix domain-containing protein n=1 Tax=unclassified Sanguibacter TaxID=2645534 RepID=UPI003FD8EBD4
MPISREQLSLAEARRVALAAQGLHRPSPLATPGLGPAALARSVAARGLTQIDSVQVLARAHHMPTYSRFGAHDVTALDRAAGRAPRRLVETWAHEASFIPVGTYPLLAVRRRRAQDYAWSNISSVARTHPEVVTRVRELVAELGPVSAAGVQDAVEHEHPRGPRTEWGWNWTVAKRCLEHLLTTGGVAVAGRTATFERLYDLPERVLPALALAEEPDDATCVRGLLEIGARAHGVGTLACFRDYFRLRGPEVAVALASLVEEGILRRVTVRGWEAPTYLHRDARLPGAAQATTLVSPFDPLVWFRPRLAALFGVDYRIGIYTPAHRRTFGYYALPLLVGDRFVARLDLRLDRRAGALEVLGAFHEPGRLPGTGVGATLDLREVVASELARLGTWLGASTVVVPDAAQGDLVSALRVAP